MTMIVQPGESWVDIGNQTGFWPGRAEDIQAMLYGPSPAGDEDDCDEYCCGTVGEVDPRTENRIKMCLYWLFLLAPGLVELVPRLIFLFQH